MDKEKVVTLECIFCHSTNFELPHKSYIPKENDTIKCSTCNKLNIYADIKAIAVEREIEVLSKEMIEELRKKLSLF